MCSEKRSKLSKQHGDQRNLSKKSGLSAWTWPTSWPFVLIKNGLFLLEIDGLLGKRHPAGFIVFSWI